MSQSARFFGDHAAIYRLVPLWIWAVLATIIIIDVVWIIATPVTVASSSYALLAKTGLIAAFGIAAGNRLDKWPRFQMLATGGAFLATAWPTLRFYNHLTMTTGFPLVDGHLAAMDATLGFDWLAYIHFLDQHRSVTIAMNIVYAGLTNYTILLFFVLLINRNGAARCRELVILFVVTATICSTAGMFFPAIAAAEHYSPAAVMFRTIDPYAGSYHLEHLLSLRDSPAPTLDLADMPGLVTFPSFHTALGIVAIYCARSSRWLLAASLLVNGLMIASTPLFGAHYGVDIIGGTAVSFIAIALLRWLDQAPQKQTARAMPAPV